MLIWTTLDTAKLLGGLFGVVIALLVWVIIRQSRRNSIIWKVLTVSTQAIKYTLIYKSWQHSRDMKLILDANGGIEEINETFMKGFGWDEHELMTEKMSMFLSPPELFRFENFKNMNAERDMDGELETVCQRKDGSPFPALIRVKKLYDDLNKTKYVYSISITNIQHRKDNEEALRQARVTTDRMCKQNALALMMMRAGSWEWELETDSISYDEGFRRIFDLTQGQKVTSQQLMGMVYHKDTKKVNVEMLESFNNGTPYRVEYRLPKRDRTLDLIKCWAIPELSPNKKPYKYNGAVLLLQENVAD